MKTRFTALQLHTGRCGSFGPFRNIGSSDRQPCHQLSDIKYDGRGPGNQVTSSCGSKRFMKVSGGRNNYQLFLIMKCRRLGKMKHKH